MNRRRFGDHLTTKDLDYLNRAIRKLTLIYSQRRICLKNALAPSDKVPALYKGRARNFYICNICGDAFRIGDVQVDHIKEIRMAECKDFNEYLGRALCPADELQVLCVNCHSFKNIEEELYGK